MNRTAIFGGAFDPPHIGHLSIASALLNSSLVDEVWFVPTGDVRDKPTITASAHRIKMLEIFFEENFNNDPTLRLELCQIKEGSPGSYTVDLMAHLRATHADRDFSFVIGTELVKDLPTWKDADRLRKEVRFLVVPRPGYTMASNHGFNVSLVPEEYLLGSSASSTAIRRLVKENKKTAGFLSPAVFSYIATKQLYR